MGSTTVGYSESLIFEVLSNTPILNKDAALSEAQLKLEYYETIFNLAREKYGLDFKKILGSGGKKPFK